MSKKLYFFLSTNPKCQKDEEKEEEGVAGPRRPSSYFVLLGSFEENEILYGSPV